MQRHKAKAGILSAIFMGLGQIYNRQFIKGLMFIAVEAVALIYFISNLGRAFWGMTTLGESPSRLEKVKGIAKMVPGDHSIVILIESLITLLFFVLFLIVWYMNIRDAYKIGAERENGRPSHTFKQSVRYILDYKFAQSFLLLPGMVFCSSPLCRSFLWSCWLLPTMPPESYSSGEAGRLGGL